ncbi:cellulose synthase operon protein YhjQ/BcsQ [Bryocella elongata]|nr:cellulose synthase operon protein YhjQ/BcsQ [Bryocella elongata]
MERSKPESNDQHDVVETPDDVAVLYSWANLQGAKYRDFSASRREYRAQLRHRQAQAQRDTELEAKVAAERAATESERAAREAEEAARFHQTEAQKAVAYQSARQAELEEAARQRAQRHADELNRQAAAERLEAARRAEAVAAAEAAARREAREMAEARASAARQSAHYYENEARLRSLTGPQPTSGVGGDITDPYVDTTLQQVSGRIYPVPPAGDDMLPSRYPQTRDARLIVPQPDPAHPVPERDREFFTTAPLAQSAELAALGAAAVEKAADQPKGPARYYYEGDTVERPAVTDPYLQMRERARAEEAERGRRPRGFAPDVASGIMPAYKPEPAIPEWISQSDAQRDAALKRAAPPAPAAPATPTPVAASPAPGSPVEDTLQHSRERVAARWYALKGVFDQSGVEAPSEAPNAVRRVPMLTVFSMAGGVGKTSLVATLGRTLSSMGERVLLTDTTSHGLLPFYFGASELRPGVVRTFSPPAGASDAAIALVSYDVSQRDASAESQEWLVKELTRTGGGMQRILLDVPLSAAWVARRMAKLNSITLVPVAPDMNSVISLGPLEKFFAGVLDEEGKPAQPFYVLNEFDASVPLHLDVREVMRRQLGDRLLPFVIRRAPAVSEALAEGMTVMDYAPDQPVAGDYMNLASWLRTQSMPAIAGRKNARWSEQ